MGDSFSFDSEPIPVSAVSGFRAGIASCGMREGKPDLGVLACLEPGPAGAAGAAILSKSTVRSGTVSAGEANASLNRVRALVLNTGHANCFTGEKGASGARALMELAADKLGIPGEQVLAASCGGYGTEFPVDLARKGVEEACARALDDGGGDLGLVLGASGAGVSAASLTGDLEGKPVRIAGVCLIPARVAGDVGGALAVITTDAAVEGGLLADLLASACESTFGRVAFDPAQCASDTVVLMASGMAGNELLDNVFSAGAFSEMLEKFAFRLVSGCGPGADGPVRPLTVRVTGAAHEKDALGASRSVAGSELVRAALASGGPAWGPVLLAAGKSGASVDESKAVVRVGGSAVYESGVPADPPAEASAAPEIELDLGLGSGTGVAWGCPVAGAGGAVDTKDLEEKLEQARREAEALEAERRGLVEEAGALRREGEAARRRAEELEAVKRALSGEADALRQEVEAARRRAEELEAGKRALVEEAGAHGHKSEAARREADALRAKSAELAGRLEEATKSLEAAEAQRHGLLERLATADPALKGAAAEVERLRGRLELAEAFARDAPAPGDAARLEAELDGLRAELAESRAARDESARDLDRTRAELDGERSRAADTGEEGARAVAENAELRSEIGALKERLDATAKELEQANVRASLKKQLTEQLLRENDEMRALVGKLKSADVAPAPNAAPDSADDA